MARKPITKIPDFDIPFDKDGNMVSYDGWGVTHHRANFVFEGELTFDEISRGRSAANFIVSDDSGKKYSMFMTDALHILQTRTVKKGRVTGKWTFCKRGMNFGVTAYDGD